MQLRERRGRAQTRIRGLDAGLGGSEQGQAPGGARRGPRWGHRTSLRRNNDHTPAPTGRAHTRSITIPTSRFLAWGDWRGAGDLAKALRKLCSLGHCPLKQLHWELPAAPPTTLDLVRALCTAAEDPWWARRGVSRSFSPCGSVCLLLIGFCLTRTPHGRHCACPPLLYRHMLPFAISK